VYVAIGLAEANPTIPVPQQFIARLTGTKGNLPITVNGNSASIGASIITGAEIETGNDQYATINLGEIGTLEIGPNTKLRIDYENGKAKITVFTGCAVLRIKKNSEGEAATEQETAGKTEKKKGGILDLCFLNGKATFNQGAAQSAITGAAGGGPAGVGAGGGGGVFASIGWPLTAAIFATAAALGIEAATGNPSVSSPTL
jgi:hypothetical protein